jgi:uncharacterized protein (TIGR02246 family)
MKRVVVVCVVLFASLAAGVALAADPAPSAGSKGLDEAWTKAMLAGDAAAVTALYADDAVLVLPGSGAIQGKQAIADTYTGWLKDFKVTDIVLSSTHYRTAGNLSTGWGQWKMTSAPKAGGAAKTETGTFISAASAKDGVWKYISDHAAADPAPPAPAKK